MKRLLLITLSILLIFTGCGNSKGDDDYYLQDEATESEDGYYSETAADNGLGFDSDFSYDTTEAPSSAGQEAAPVEGNQTASESNAGKITKTMLVYRGRLDIDTLDFDKSVSDFKSLISEKGGFVETESYSDNSSTSGYYVVDSDRKHNIYNATVRVPSAEYDAIMNSANVLGDIRNRSSEATNVTQEYGTYKSQLEIYQAEYNRYLSLLEKATEDEYALMIENELFDIQLKIASLKSGISNIENDVAYSYINIYIKEVSVYEKKPAPTDTFFERFKNTCSESWSNFLEFLEELLFGIIMNIYAIIIILIIVFIVWKKLRKKIAAKKVATAGQKNIAVNVTQQNEAVNAIQKNEAANVKDNSTNTDEPKQ